MTGVWGITEGRDAEAEMRGKPNRDPQGTRARRDGDAAR